MKKSEFTIKCPRCGQECTIHKEQVCIEAQSETKILPGQISIFDLFENNDAQQSAKE